MTTTIIKNTHIKELMEVASGNMEVLEKMTEEFRRLVHKRPKKTADAASLFKKNLPAAKYDGDTRACRTTRRGHISMTTQRAISVVTEIIRENRENGELEGALNRHRIAALNHLVRLAEASKSEAEKPRLNG